MTAPQDVLRELGDPTRLRELGLAQPQVSYHLRRLKDVGLAVEEKDGRWVYYEANAGSEDAQTRALLSLLGRWFDGVPPAAVTPVTPPAPRPVEKRDDIEDFLL
jgi:DNA-binding transcriptional ArsR family regulator